MRIKKFEADTLQEALSRVKKDFGSEAVILHTKKFKTGGIFGIFGRERTEVTAGVDINVDRPQRKEQPAAQIPQLSRQEPNRILSRQPATGQAELEVLNTYRRIEDISLKNEMLSRELNEGKISVNTAVRGQRETSFSQTMPSAAGLKDGLSKLQKTLMDNGVEESIVFRALQHINTQLAETQLNNRAFMEKFIVDYISDMIQVSGPIKTAKGTTKVMAMIGPTGVGKTTTIAKLAARFALMENKRVVMVSADTYRIAADLQLKKYGDIMGIPVEIVLTPQDFLKVINKHIDKDIILFDTAGRSKSVV